MRLAAGLPGLSGRAGKGRCLPPDQRVLTPGGYRPVSAVDAREAVFTGQGRIRLVIAVQSRQADEALYHLRTVRGNVLRATGEHRLLARRQEGVPAWHPARALVPGDLVAVFGGTSLGGWLGGGRRPDARRGPDAALVVQEDAATYLGLDWAALERVVASPYRGVVYDLDVEEDHCCISEGFVLSACAAG